VFAAAFALNVDSSMMNTHMCNFNLINFDLTRSNPTIVAVPSSNKLANYDAVI